MKAFAVVLATIVAFLGGFIGHWQYDDGNIRLDLLGFIDDKVPGLKNSYAQLQSDQFSDRPPLFGPLNNDADQKKWKTIFDFRMRLLNMKRKASGKQEISYKLSFTNSSESSTDPVKKAWPVSETIDWIEAHS